MRTDGWCRLVNVHSSSSLNVRSSSSSFSMHRAFARRRLLSAVVIALLLFMQHDANFHALQHDGMWFEHAHEQGLQVPAIAKLCAQCALLAGGANAIAAGTTAAVHGETATWRVVSAFTSHPVARPSYYSSRAPPLAT
jgi:hypothetical protein